MNTFLKMAWTITLLFILPNLFYGQAPNLGAASDFALFTSAGAFNVTGASDVTGDVGTNVGSIVGFPPGTLDGAEHEADATTAMAAMNLGSAYADLSGRTCGIVLGTPFGNGLVLTPNVYCVGQAASLNGDLVLDGNCNSNTIFIFKIDGALSTNANSSITLINGASACNVFWQVNGAVELGSGSSFQGTIVAAGAISFLSGSSLEGRALTTMGAISLTDNFVSIGGEPSAAAITAGGLTTFCEGSSVVLSGNCGGTWSNGSTAPSITVTTSGNYFVTNSNSCGSDNSNSINVTVTQAPSCTITGDNSICQGQSTELCAPTGTSFQYSWSTGATTRCITVSTAGTYSVTVTVAGCSNICSRTVTVSPLPACTISGDASLCDGQTSQLCVPAGASSYLWSTGATTNCIMVDEAGIYSVTVTNTSGCTTTCSQAVTVNPLPACAITGDDAICEGQSTELCVPSGAASYLWSTGATTNCITVGTLGTYSVTVTNADGCTSICSHSVTVNPLPACTITGVDAICEGQTGQLCIPSGAASYLWSTGATTNCITVSTGGTFSVTVTSSSGCTSVCSKTVTLDLAPVASVLSANGPLVFCEPNSVILSGNSGGTWNTGATTPTITVNTSGDYYVTNSNTCGMVNSNHFIVQVDTLLMVSILVADGDTIFCEPDSVILSGNDGGTWSTGATTPSITVKTSGDYFVTTSNSCDTFISNHILVTMIPLPVPSVISADGPTAICEEDSVILTGNNGGIWSTGATTVSITVKTAGDYFVTNMNICDTVTSNHLLITVDTLLTIDSIFASGATTFCIEDSVILSGNDGGVWNTGDTSASIIVKSSGDYFVLKENACASLVSNHIVVTVFPEFEPTTITASEATTFCEGDSVVLSGNVGGIWTTGETTATITVKTSGEFYVINQNICDSVTSNHIVVTVIEGSAGVILSDTICKGESINLGGLLIPGHTYSWSPTSSLSSSTVSNPIANPVVTTTYKLIESIAGLTCQITTFVNITVFPYPPCVIKGNPKICEGQSTSLCAPAGPYTYLWSNGDTSRCIEVSVLGRYTVTVTNAMGCSSICGQTVVRGEGPCEITGKSDIYAGNTTVLCATSGYASYLWSTGATTPCITVGGAGTYSVTLTTSNGCVSVCSKTVNIIPVLCEIQIDTLCKTLYTLCATEVAGNTYYWTSGGQTTRCITVDCSGTYGVRVTNSRKSSTCSVYINAKVWGPRAQTTWSINGNLTPSQGQISTLCAPFGFSEYHWSNGAKTQCINVNTSGFYGVNFSYKTGCSGSAGTTVNYSSSRRASTVDIAPPVVLPGHTEVRAYPNPFKQSAVFEVQNNESDAHVTIELCDLTGMKVARVFDADVVRGTRYTTVFDAGLLADGIYFYRYISGDQVISRKLILMK